MFLGQFRHQLDSKGRVAVPAHFRRGLPDGSVIAYGTERRLVIYPPEEWQQVADLNMPSGSTDAEGRVYQRRLFSTARELELDAQGRLLLSPEQRSFAGIDDRAVFVGTVSRVEVVGEPIWDAETAALTPDDFTQLHDQVHNSGAAAPNGGAG